MIGTVVEVLLLEGHVTSIVAVADVDMVANANIDNTWRNKHTKEFTEKLFDNKKSYDKHYLLDIC